MTDLNNQIDAGRGKVDRLEAEIVDVYRRILDAAARDAAKRFRQRAPIRRSVVTAAVDPEWTPPAPSELVDAGQIAIQANGKTRPLYERALRLMGEAAIGISFDVTNVFAGQLLDQVAAKAAAIIDGYPDLLATAIRDAHEQGLSVANAAAMLRERGLDASKVTADLLARTSLNAVSNGSSLLAAQTVAAADGGGPRSKTWITAGDERVRDTHAEADGQTVPLDQPFDVGGEQLSYPGDPNGSLEETANCRCTIVYDAGVSAAGRPPTDPLQSSGTVETAPEDTSGPAPTPVQLRDFHLTAAAGEPTRWNATLLVEGEPTEDGRMIAVGGATFRGLPLPLGWMDTSSHGMPGPAPIIGRIDQIWKAGPIVQAAGIFNDMADTFAAECVQKIGDGMVTGVSVDGVAEWEIVITRRDDTAQEEEAEQQVAESVGGEILDDPYADDDVDMLYVATTYTIMGATVCPAGATVCPAGAIARAQISIVAAGDEERAQILTPLQPTRCEVPPAPVVAAAVDLAPLEERFVALEAFVRDGLAPLATKLVGMEGLLLASANALEQVDGRFSVLTKIETDLRLLRETAERKPRVVEFARNAEGQLTGLVEQTG